jgi:hypothetical protein
MAVASGEWRIVSSAQSAAFAIRHSPLAIRHYLAPPCLLTSRRIKNRSARGRLDAIILTNHVSVMMGSADYFATAATMSRAERLARLDALSRLFDTAFIVPGTNFRFGLDALIGLVPGIGDAITTAISLYIVNEARALGAPRLLIARMVANVALDGVVGAIPLVGDAFDVAFRANRRNMALLRDHLERTRPRDVAYRMGKSDYR